MINTEKYTEKVLSTANVAVVSTNEINTALLSRVLKDIGVKVKSFISISNLSENLEKTEYNLFILDIASIRAAGFECMKIIKKSTVNCNTPVMVISRPSDVKSMLQAYDMGAYFHLEEPLNTDVIKCQIGNVLRKQIKRKEINRQSENFVAMLVHDLKNPINAEIKTLELLIDEKFGKLNNFQNKIITGILNSAKYTMHITTQILCFYKCNNSYISLKKEEIEFSKLLQDCIASMKFLFEDRNQHVRVYDKSENKKVFADIIEMKRVICNLLSNASEYSPENNDIDIILNLEGTGISCTVRDYGYGIKAENMENIFDEYITLAKQQKKAGFGLGLNICKKIIDAHKGTITLESKYGEGTTITFTLP